MKNAFFYVAYLALNFGAVSAQSIVRDFNAGWLFSETDSPDYSLTTYQPSAPQWESVVLPHDWSINKLFDQSLEGCTGFLPGGIGWYSKSFDTPIDLNREKCYILFDGVYNNADFWINGKHIDFHPFGYAPIYYDLTPYLSAQGQPNRLSVRVDHSRYADSRWYTGSGIYRDVKLITAQKLHFEVWGQFVTTLVVTDEKAEIQVELSLCNDWNQAQQVEVRTQLRDALGKVVATYSQDVRLAARSHEQISQSLLLPRPQRWGVDRPYLYTATSSILLQGKEVGQIQNRFGVRTLKFDRDKGFFLNGESVKVKGVCLHHDAGLAGAAVPKDVWKRRLLELKEMGCNAIRTAHNPASDEFLDLCDELGFLVQNEFYDEWDLPKDKRFNMQDKQIDYITRGHSQHFQNWAKTDLQNTMRSSRNHPSVFQWSIGNEIEWTYPGHRRATGFFKGTDRNGRMDWTLWRSSTPPHTPEQVKAFWSSFPEQTYDIGTTAQQLAAWTRELDTTRVVTANLILPTSSLESSYAEVLDVVGFSYKPDKYDYFRETYPDKTFMGTENVVQWYEWKACVERDYIAGIFLWTGIEYLGEKRANEWPSKGSGGSPLDLAGFRKPSYYMFQSLWSDEPVLAIYSQKEEKSTFTRVSKNKAKEKKQEGWKRAPRPWQAVNKNWNYEVGETVMVEVYTNCEEVELFQNGKSLGVNRLADNPDHILKWAVDYEPGVIEARAQYKDGRPVRSQEITVGKPVAVKLVADRTMMQANDRDAVHVIAQLVDEQGNEVYCQDETLQFRYQGDVAFLGTDCGNSALMSSYSSLSCPTYQGRALLILQAKDQATAVTIEALFKSNQQRSNEVCVNVK